MLRIDNKPATVFSCVDEAIAFADQMGADDDWEYVVVADPKGSGRAIVEIYDGDGHMVGKA